MSALLYISLFLIIYTYAGYPLSMWALGKALRRRTRKADGGASKKVSILIAAYNEEKYIRATVMNKLAQDYPKDSLEIIVASDASSDGTDAVCRDLSKKYGNVKFLRMGERRGKAAALNAAIKEAKGEIIVFSDANSMYREDAVTHLVRNFVDPSVGYVTGHMVYMKRDGTLTEEGCSSYMKYENFIRRSESAASSVVGVNGGIDAVRKDLYEAIREDLISDFVIPLMVVKKGYRVVYDPKAVLEEDAHSDSEREARMRVRVIVRALHALVHMRSLFNFFRYPLFSYQIFFHKLLRYLMPLLLIAFIVLNAALAPKGGVYPYILIGQAVFYAAAVAGYFQQRLNKTNRLLYIPFYFCLVNLSALKAIIGYLKGERQVTWQPRSGN